jgi:hypothetical protein
VLSGGHVAAIAVATTAAQDSAAALLLETAGEAAKVRGMNELLCGS